MITNYLAIMTKKITTNEKILNAAIASLIDGQGNIEMSDVAKRATVSVGLAYHYYKSKAGLLSAVVTHFYDQYDEIANQKTNDTRIWQEREYDRLTAIIDFLYASPLASIMLGKISSSPEVIAVENERMTNMVKLAMKNISEGQENGDLRLDINLEITAAAIVGGIRQAIIQALASDTRLDKKIVIDQIWNYIAIPLQKDS